MVRVVLPICAVATEVKPTTVAVTLAVTPAVAKLRVSDGLSMVNDVVAVSVGRVSVYWSV